MHLVAPLTAGITGAENGTAEVYIRGTTVRAPYWLTFEAVSGSATSDVPLDSYGGATIYVNALCNIVVKTSGGATLREFVAGDRDDCIEVMSPSFTGTGYGGGGTMPGAPTTLGDVLDRWHSFNGGVDWQVGVPGGAQLPISAAIAGSYGLVFNVKAYAAVGDGVANDTNALNSAIAAAAAAGGGIVYLPPGTYRNTGISLVNGDVSLIGAGPASTAMVLDTTASSAMINLNPPTVADRFGVIANMRMTTTVPVAANFLRVRDNSRYLVHNVFMDGTNHAANLLTLFGGGNVELVMADCVFIVPALDSAIGRISSTTIARRLTLHDCRFVTQATAPVYVVDAPLAEISGCHFVNNATSSGAFSCIRATTSVPADLRVIGCKFSDASGSAVVTAVEFGSYGATARVHEAGNIFGATVTAYSYTATAAGRGSHIALLSRETRSIFVTNNTAAPILPLDQYGLVVLSSTFAGLITFSAAAVPPDGARGTIAVAHPAASTVIAGANFLNPVATTTATGAGHVWEYRACTPAAAPRMALIVDGRSLGSSL